MGMLNKFFKPKPSLLKPEDINTLKNIERESYMEEAKKLIKERGVSKAKQEFGIKEPKKNEW